MYLSIFKCKMCGGTIEFEQGATVGVCDYCGTKQTLPKLDDDRRANLYDRANHFRRNNEFDKAAGIYEQILTEDGTDAEAYWSLVLCRYGIEYVEDPATRKRVPTVNRAQFTSIFDDDNYKSAIEHADGFQRSLYEEEANAINEIQKGILAISREEQPFDVFICYKETDANGRRTPDSVLANDLYHQLTQEGFRVFFSRITLEDKLGTAYEPYIFAALNSAKVMVVLGTRQEYFNAVWVKNEWRRYLSLVKASGGKKVLIPAYKDMDPYDLPDEFSHLQAQDMSKLGFMQDLIRGIKKIAQEDEPKTPIKETVVVNSAGANVVPLLKRAFMFLEDGEWAEADSYCEKVLDQDPENAQAYLGKLMAELNVKTQEDLKNCEQPFDMSNNYKKVVRFGDEKLSSELNGYISHINERNELTRLTDIYNSAVYAMNSAKTESAYASAAAAFKKVPGFEDADSLAEQCLEKAEEQRKLAEQKKEETKRKALPFVRALKEGPKAKREPTLEERLAAAKTKVGYLERILNVFDATQFQIQALQSEFNAAGSREKQLTDQQSRLGIFAVKEKKRISEELVTVSARKSDLAARIEENQKSLGNYTSAADIERDLREARKKVNDVERQIISAREKGDHEYSFEEALNAYLKDPDVTCAVNTMLYPTMSRDSIVFGRYIQKGNGLPEPIEWQVLARKNDRILVISRYALDCQQYNTSFTSVTWETCSLRKWLNGTFLNAAFSESERAMIPSVTVSADKNTIYSTSPGNSTTDQVFLLSIKEVNKYFSSDSVRLCQGTAYCFAQGANKASHGNCWWWLRSPGFDSYYASYVQYYGSVGNYCCLVDNDVGAVRPAMWISFD